MEYEGYKIESDGTFGYQHIKPLGKGSVHMSLRGAYTCKVEASKAIDKYLLSKLEKTSGNTKSSNGS